MTVKTEFKDLLHTLRHTRDWKLLPNCSKIDKCSPERVAMLELKHLRASEVTPILDSL